MKFQNDMKHFPHITVHISMEYMTHNLKSVSIFVLFLTINTISLWPQLLDADISCSLVGQMLIALWGK
jgi:hypothetical protein